MGRKTIIEGNALLILFSVLLLSATRDNNKKGFDTKSFEKSLKYIPMGSFIFEDSSMMGYTKAPKMVSVIPCYMCDHVVTNNEYHEFLDELKGTDPKVYAGMLPDTLVWRNKQAFMDDMVKYYFQHPSYQDYPVVGISHEQAEEYCKWLTQRYAKEPKRKYKNVKFRLPTIYEWEWAAMGGLVESSFPWGGPYVRNYRGQMLANFIHTSEAGVKREGDTGKLILTNGGAYYMGVAGDLDDAADITSPVKSYWPNGYGLYNMAGNVEEFVDEVGIAKGGSWHDPGYYLQIWAQMPYKSVQSASDCRGFRILMTTAMK